MGIWRERITMGSELWQCGFRLILIREAFRSLINEYGDEIVTLFASDRG